MEYKNALRIFNKFKETTDLMSYSFIPSINFGFDIYLKKHREYILKKYCQDNKAVYLIGLSNNKINKKLFNLSGLMGVVLFGKWTDKKGRIYTDVSVLISNITDKIALVLAKYYNQQTIIKVSHNRVIELTV